MGQEYFFCPESICPRVFAAIITLLVNINAYFAHITVHMIHVFFHTVEKFFPSEEEKVKHNKLSIIQKDFFHYNVTQS